MPERIVAGVRVALLFALLCVSGCASQGGSPEQVCRRQAQNDPEVRALMQRAIRGQWLRSDYIGRVRFLEQQATLRCLQKRGVVPPGGVEPVEKLGD